ncbi:MAG: division/cell wall cluster transcriptional repressor MraZ [Deltaproteobacteria bacterium]|nr:division/cell wall cluster transcriptional repressor MraZ [Deltaproteobacteria bacterium]MBW2417035.1 division/cell wall cluster transcriptional repressor MraZ [Deltaproteobacteria bacterium]
MFRGRHDHTIDKKGRVSIPAAFRTILARSEQAPIITNDKDHLTLHRFEDWEVFEQDLKAKSKLRPNVAKYTRVVIGEAMDCPIDSQGRILIPPRLRKRADLDGKATIAGTIDKIEIWNTERYEADISDTLDHLDEVQVSVDQSPAA